jgi:hypothetical protein
MLDAFFLILEERNSLKADIFSVTDAEMFYRKYFEEKGMTQSDYEIRGRNSISNGVHFWISSGNIKRIAGSVRSNDNSQADGGALSPGGIDMRSLPISVEQGRAGAAAGGNALEKSPALDAEWQKIEDLVNKGLLPETAMIKEYLQACRRSNKVPVRTERVLSCIAEILRMEEDCCKATDPYLKELLVLLEN